MRLQLTIQRQSLPPVKLLWSSAGLRQTFGDEGGIGPTISQLLEQVNEIIPLEAEDWGLEDYSVEVGGFECLHFALLNQILKEDDHVSIRPLQTTDIRHHRICGRRQISSDGRHLIDGVAFGRPYLRRADRPSIKIPPRKRIRLAYNDEDEYEGTGVHHEGFQIAATARPLDEQAGMLDSSDQDYEDNAISVDELIDLENDLHVLSDQGTSIESERTVNLDGASARPPRRFRSLGSRQGLGIRDAGVLALVDENGRQYPGEYHNPLLDYYDQEHFDQLAIRPRRNPLGKGAQPKSTLLKRRQNGNVGGASRRSSSASLKEVRFEGDGSNTPAVIPSLDDSDDSDEDFEPDQDTGAESVESNKENVKPNEAASSSDCESATTEVTSSNSSSESDSDSDSEDDLDNSETSSSLSSSIGQEKVVQRTETSNEYDDTGGPPTMAITPTQVIAKKKMSTTKPEGQGQKHTQKRNQRRRDHKRMLYLKRIGVLPPDARVPEYKKWNEAWQETKQGSGHETSTPEKAGPADRPLDFESKRQELLESIAAAGVDADRNEEEVELSVTPAHTTIDQIHTPKAQHVNLIDNSTASEPTHKRFERASETATTGEHISNYVEANSEPPRRRPTLDIASSRRLLFGAMGKRTPKTIAEEIKLREKLMENVRPIRMASSLPGDELAEENAVRNLESNDEWQKKIILKAVECCYEGIELSTPPFPFVQRWDPQQKGNYHASMGRGSGKSKKRKRNQPQYYEAGPAQGLGEFTEQRQQDTLGNDLQLFNLDQPEHAELQRAETAELQNAVDDQLMRDTHEQSSTQGCKDFDKDNPLSLPEDVSTCNALAMDSIAPGALIAFRQLEMSQETNWQPKISNFRTAIVNKVLESGKLEVSLAQCDRPVRQKYYDQETGERIYSKFEMPDYDEELEDDRGFFEIAFAEMIEPKLIRAASLQRSGQQLTVGRAQAQAVNLSAVKESDEMSFENDDPASKQVDVIVDVIEQEIGVDKRIVNGAVNFQDRDTKVSGGQLNEENSGQHHEIDEDDRKEISMLIKDAGFRSSIGTDIGGTYDEAIRLETAVIGVGKRGDGLSDTFSPQFKGFSSSPPMEESSKLSSKKATTISSPPTQADYSNPLGLGTAKTKQPHQDGAGIPNHDMNGAGVATGLVSESISQESIETLVTLIGINHAQARKALEKYGGDISRASNWVLDHQNKDHDMNDDDEFLVNGSEKPKERYENFLGQAWLPSDEVVPGALSQESLEAYSPPLIASPPTRSKGRGTRKLKSSKDVVSLNGTGIDSDSDFPAIENMFSTARTTMSSPESEESHKQNTRASKRSKSSRVISQSQPERLLGSQVPRSREAQRLMAYTAQIERDDAQRAIAEEVSASSDEGDLEIPSRSSQAPVQSQVVDLTISSSQDDAPDPDSDYDDPKSAGLPNGPGWVQKGRNGIGARRTIVNKGVHRMSAKGRKTKSMYG